MAMPRKLKNMNVFNEGRSWLGEATSVTLPKLARKFEEYRGAGMDGTVMIDMGAEPMELEATCGGYMRDVITQYGAATMAGFFIRFAGVYEDDETGNLDRVEITVRGRHQEIDRGEQKMGEGGEFKFKTACIYYREEWNGQELVEIDVLNMIHRVDGFDRLAAQRAALL